MFLATLNLEQKKSFLKLAKYLANIDNHLHEEEQYLLNYYCYEMHIDDNIDDHEEFKISDLADLFKEKKEKRILLIELIALIIADSEYNEKEKEILNQIIDLFQIDLKLLPVYFNWAKAITALAKQGQALLEL